ncbi:hypothetical protein GCM10010357_33860 [Streptomyces luteireticuli]|uniref:Uncharacterized protein n=1 Tax=Streptomyces luteireticuli TaxID=173858 RepID=A0ABP3IM78_9ACTN
MTTDSPVPAAVPSSEPHPLSSAAASPAPSGAASHWSRFLTYTFLTVQVVRADGRPLAGEFSVVLVVQVERWYC